MKMKTKVDEINGFPVFFNKEPSYFEVEISEKLFEATSLPRLKLDVEESNVRAVDIEAIYNSTDELIPIKIIRIDGRGRLHLSSNRMGVRSYIDPEDVNIQLFPTSKHNMAVLARHIKLREQGWDMLKTASKMQSELENFPKGFFEAEKFKKKDELRHTCGGRVDFDSFGNFKCRKCGKVTKNKSELIIE